MARDVRLLTEPFNPGQFVGPFANAHPGLGGICTFVGEVRADGDVEALELLHYAPMTLAGMELLADTAIDRFGLMGILIVHRSGVMHPGEPIVQVSAARDRRGRFCDGPSEIGQLVLETRIARRGVELDRTARSRSRRSFALG